MDERFPGDWPTLFGAPTTSLRAVFLGDPSRPDTGIVELVDLGAVPGPADSAAGPAGSRGAAALGHHRPRRRPRPAQRRSASAGRRAGSRWPG